MEGHGHAGNGYVGTQSLSDPGKLPKRAQESGFLPIQKRGPDGSDVGTGADHQQHHRQQRLEVEQRRHDALSAI